MLLLLRFLRPRWFRPVSPGGPVPAVFALPLVLTLALALTPPPARAAESNGAAPVIQPPQAPATLPEVPKGKPLTLRVLYLEHPRLPTLATAQRQELYRRVEGLLATWYGYRATLREIGAQDFAGYLAAHEVAWRRHLGIVLQDLALERPDGRAELSALLGRIVAPLSAADFARYFPALPPGSPAENTRAAEAHFLNLLNQMRAVPLPAGGTLGEALPPAHTGYMHWCALAYESREADVLLTNGMLLGADAEMDAGIVARGGATFGNCNGNRYNAIAATVQIPLFPVLSEAPFWVRERGAIPPAERLDVAATLFLHELGHMLLRYKHPQGHGPGCIHAPAPGPAPLRLAPGRPRRTPLPAAA